MYVWQDNVAEIVLVLYEPALLRFSNQRFISHLLNPYKICVVTVNTTSCCFKGFISWPGTMTSWSPVSELVPPSSSIYADVFFFWLLLLECERGISLII